MEHISFYSPETLDEALRILHDEGGRVIAGGTDLIPQMRSESREDRCLIDTTRLSEMQFIREEGENILIGSLTTYKDIVDSSYLRRDAGSLVQAAFHVGSPQTRSRGTIGGNLGNASPAGDTLPPLLTLNANVHLCSVDGERSLRLEDFLLGPGKTALKKNEIIHHLSFEKPSHGTRTSFMRLGSRAGMAVSIASSAVVLRVNAKGIVEDARIALGAVAPTAIRCPEAEGLLMGELVSDELIAAAALSGSQECSPIDDLRGTARYRRNVVFHLIKRCLDSMVEVA